MSVLYRNIGSSYPVAASSAGMFIYDGEGNEWLDMSGGAAVSMVGHGHPKVIEAVTDQVKKLAFAHTAFFTNRPQERLAARIADRFGEPGAQVYFSSGGSEANETAFKLAWQYWQARGHPEKKVIISREHSYHGNTLGGLSASGNPARRKASAAPLIDWPRVSPCHYWRFGEANESEEDYALRLARELDETIEAAGPWSVAAFVLEPVVGASLGVVPASRRYLEEVRKVCDKHDILLIFDEVMCGSGRTGRYFAFEHYGVRPDIVTMAKGIAGGYMPLAATVAREKIIDGLGTSGFEHGHTYIGHPVACAAGNAVLSVIEDDDLLPNAREMEAKFQGALEEGTRECALTADIRGAGFFMGVEFNREPANRKGFVDGTDIPGRLKASAMNNGLICYPGGARFENGFAPHILFAPPLIAEWEHFDMLAEKLNQICWEVFG